MERLYTLKIPFKVNGIHCTGCGELYAVIWLERFNNEPIVEHTCKYCPNCGKERGKNGK